MAFCIERAILQINVKIDIILLFSTTTFELFRDYILEILPLKITFFSISYAFSFVFAFIGSATGKINVKLVDSLVLL